MQNNFYPATYQPFNPNIGSITQSNPNPVPMPTGPSVQSNPVPMPSTPNMAYYGVPWVHGEEGARNYPVAPGNSVILMDQDNSIFYIKSADQNGMVQPLRIFDYTERTAQQAQPNNPEYVTREEFDKAIKNLTKPTDGKKGKRNE